MKPFEYTTMKMPAGTEVHLDGNDRKYWEPGLRPGVWVTDRGTQPVWAQADWADHMGDAVQYATSTRNEQIAHHRKEIAIYAEQGDDRAPWPILTYADGVALRPHRVMVGLDALFLAERRSGRALMPWDQRMFLFRKALQATCATPARLRAKSGEVKNPGVTLCGDVVLHPAMPDPTRNMARSCAGVLRGKFNRMSPEMVAGRALGEADQVWSLGLLLHRLTHPGAPELFRRENEVKTLEAIYRGETPAFREDLDNDIAELLRACLVKEPKHRISSPDALFEAAAPLLPRATRGEVGSTMQTLFGELYEQQVNTMRELCAAVGAAKPVDDFADQTAVDIQVNDPQRALLPVHTARGDILLDKEPVSVADWALFALEAGHDERPQPGADPDAPKTGLRPGAMDLYARWAKKRVAEAIDLAAAVVQGIALAPAGGGFRCALDLG